MLVFYIFLLFYIGINGLDLNQAKISVYLSGAAYCGKENYKTMKLIGPASGFVYEDTLYDVKTDLQGFIGVLSSTKTIYVSMRGSSSVMNWLDDAEVKLVDYKTWSECNCKVHNGFYRSALGVSNKTIEVVKLLSKRYPSYSVLVTGHSYGASTSQLLGMELERMGIKVSIYDFGQPRVGDSKYGGFVNTIINDNWRFTHNKDVVPHVPPQSVFGYLHSCREVFEDQSGNLKVCSESNCEDPTCADQFSIYQTNSDDHSYYLSHRLDCSSSTTI